MERRSLIQLILVTPILSLLERLGLRQKPMVLKGTDEYVDFGPVNMESGPDRPFTMSMWAKHTPKGLKILSMEWSTQHDDGQWHTYRS